MPFWALRAWRRWVTRTMARGRAVREMLRTGDVPFFGGPWDGDWAELAWTARVGLSQSCVHARYLYPGSSYKAPRVEAVGGYVLRYSWGRYEWCDGRASYLAHLKTPAARIDATRYFDEVEVDGVDVDVDGHDGHDGHDGQDWQ